MMVVLTSGFSFAQRHTFFDQCEKEGKLQHKTPMATDQAKTTPAAAKGVALRRAALGLKYGWRRVEAGLK